MRPPSIVLVFLTMPKAKPVASLSGLIDTNMEDDTLNMEADAFPTPDSNQENGQAKRKGRGKATTKRFTKPRVRRSGEGIAMKTATPKPRAGMKRAPLKGQKNTQQEEETEEVDEFEAQSNEDTAMDELVEPNLAEKRKAPQKKAGRPRKKAAVQQVNPVQKDGEFEFTPTAVRQTKGNKNVPTALALKANASKPQQSAEPEQEERVIPETQIPMETEPSVAPEADQDDEGAIPQSRLRRTINARNDRSQRQPLVARRLGDSGSDTERAGNDPAIRRKLGEMTKKLASLELKYNNLKEVGTFQAKAKFQELEASTQARAKGK